MTARRPARDPEDVAAMVAFLLTIAFLSWLVVLIVLEWSRSW